MENNESLFKDIPGLEYFEFEDDFVADNLRCIPMIIRFKMDLAGIKLHLKEWSQFTNEEKIRLALQPCGQPGQVTAYRNYLSGLVADHTGCAATQLAVDTRPEWKNIEAVPPIVSDMAAAFGWTIAADQWKRLSYLQRFAMVKLCRPGHENRNFPKAIKEFKLTDYDDKV